MINRINLILLVLIFLLECCTLKMRSNKLVSKYRVKNNDTAFAIVSIPLGEFEKFAVEIEVKKKNIELVEIDANILFVDSVHNKGKNIYFILCKKDDDKVNLGKPFYQTYNPVDTVFVANKAGIYSFELSKKVFKKNYLIVFFENWFGYVYQ